MLITTILILQVPYLSTFLVGFTTIVAAFILLAHITLKQIDEIRYSQLVNEFINKINDSSFSTPEYKTLTILNSAIQTVAIFAISAPCGIVVGLASLYVYYLLSQK